MLRLVCIFRRPITRSFFNKVTSLPKEQFSHRSDVEGGFLELLVLGTSAAYPGAGKACSGYLIKKGRTHILIDIGTGVLSNLLRWLNPSKLQGIVITHLHPDHFLDIYPLRYFLQFDGSTQSPIRILAPPGAEEFITQLVDKEGKRKFRELFQFVNINDEDHFKLGEIELRFQPVSHFIPTYGVIIGDKQLVYSSDCAYDFLLSSLAEGAKTLLCESTLQGRMSSGHLTGEQAGLLAQKAGVKRLFLTHFWPSLDLEVFKKEAEKTFPGEIFLARENERYQLE